MPGGLESARWIRERETGSSSAVAVCVSLERWRLGRGLRARRPIALLSRRRLQQHEQKDGGGTHVLLFKTTDAPSWPQVQTTRRTPLTASVQRSGASTLRVHLVHQWDVRCPLLNKAGGDTNRV